MLGCRYVGRVRGNEHMAGTGRIWLDNVRCRGCEKSLDRCSHSGWGSSDCSHQDDVIIACYDHTIGAAPGTTGTSLIIFRNLKGTKVVLGLQIWIYKAPSFPFPVLSIPFLTLFPSLSSPRGPNTSQKSSKGL